MSIEYTKIKKEIVIDNINKFLKPYPETANFSIIINSKKGNVKIKVNKIRTSRTKKLIGYVKKKLKKRYQRGN